MERNEELINICIDIFSDIGLINFANLLKRARDVKSEESFVALLEEESRWLNFETEKKRRMVEFGDESRFIAMRYHIVNVYRTWQENRPVLILNSMAEDVTMKDNPLKNVVLLYEDDRVRDRDYDRLRMILG